MKKKSPARAAFPPSDAVKALVYGLLYFAFSAAGVWLFPSSQGFSSFWLPAGLAVSAFIISPRRRWPLFAISQFAANAALNLIAFHSAPSALAYSAANLAEAMAGAWLVLRFARGSSAFERLSTTFGFVGCAGIAAPALGASLSLAAMAALGRVADPLRYWSSWFGADGLGILVLAVPVIVWHRKEEFPFRKRSLATVAEAVLIMAALLATVYVGFVSPARANPAFRYLVMPVLLWAGIRFPARFVSLVNFAFMILMYASIMVTTPRGDGAAPFELPVIGRIFFLIGFIFDFLPCVAFAGLRNAERSLRQSEADARRLQAQYQDLLETSQDLIWQCDAEGRFIYLNTAWDRTFGFTHDEMIGLKYYDLVEPATVAALKGEIVKMAEEGSSIMGREIRIRRKDGSSVLLMCNIKAVKGEGGEFAGARGTAYDITERRRLEEAMYIAQKQESLGVLAGGLAHDFNNLLGGVFGFIEFAMKADDVEKARGYLRRTLVPFERAKDLTRQLLTFSKGGTPAKQTGSLAEVLRESVGFALAGRNVQAEYLAVQELPDFAFDPNQMGQVFQNIAINACEAMPEGGRLEISVDSVAIGPGSEPLAPGDYARVRMRDLGPGIPPDVAARVFDPFFTTKKKGSGLGLAICYSIVAKHKGLITAETALEGGARFTILLPLLRPEDRGFLREADGGASESYLGSGRALVMDDEPYMRELGAELLEGLGFEALSAEDGDIALSICSRAMEEGRPIRLALLDLTVPGGRGGLETVAELRRAYGSSLRVIAASGYAEDPVIANPSGYGFDGALAKPYMMSELARLLAAAPPPSAQET